MASSCRRLKDWYNHFGNLSHLQCGMLSQYKFIVLINSIGPKPKLKIFLASTLEVFFVSTHLAVHFRDLSQDFTLSRVAGNRVKRREGTSTCDLSGDGSLGIATFTLPYGLAVHGTCRHTIMIVDDSRIRLVTGTQSSHFFSARLPHLPWP